MEILKTTMSAAVPPVFVPLTRDHVKQPCHALSCRPHKPTGEIVVRAKTVRSMRFNEPTMSATAPPLSVYCGRNVRPRSASLKEPIMSTTAPPVYSRT